jgi:DNA repair protein RecN (Recombination protein N)
VEREILAGGKSRAFVGSRPVAVSLLKELAPHLGDIHGQHDQQLLFLADAQRDMLDAFAGQSRNSWSAPPPSTSNGARPAPNWKNWSAASRRSCACWTSGQFQRKEIESAALAPEEDAALENERRVLQNVQKLEEAANIAYAAVYDAPESAVSLTRAAARRVDELCRIDTSLEAVREHLKAADLSLQEASYTLRDYLGRLEGNPGRLEEVETRLAAIDKLKRKYGQSIAEILSFLDEVRRQIAAVEHAGERMEELRREQKRVAGEFENWPPI